MRRVVAPMAGAAALAAFAVPAAAEPVVWGFQAEQFEYRVGEEDLLAWDLDAFVGGDELRLRYQGEGEYAREEEALETFEHQLFLQTPITDFFDAKAGVRYDAPEGADQLYAALGVVGLTRQWAEVDLTGYVSDDGDLSLRLDAEYEALITNRLALTPSVEIGLPFTDDEEAEYGAWGPVAEIGARLSYDLIGRSVAPYVGATYEVAFGESSDIAQADGGEDDALYFVAGARLVF